MRKVFARDSKCRGCASVNIFSVITKQEYYKRILDRSTFLRDYVEDGVRYQVVGAYDFLCEKCSKV